MTLQSGHYDGGVTQAEPGATEEVDEAAAQAEAKELERNSSRDFSPFGRPKPAVSKATRVFTEEELSAHTTAETGIYLAAGVERTVFDVTAGADFYGPGGGYAFFAGRNASRGLATSSLDPATLDEAPAGKELSGLGEEELATLAEWVAKFEEKYPLLGVLDAADNLEKEEEEEEEEEEEGGSMAAGGGRRADGRGAVAKL